MDLASDRLLSAEDGFALLEALVDTPSLSGREAMASALLAQWMANHGFAARVDEADNAIGMLDGGPAADGSPPRDIILLGHIDTVGGWPAVKRRDGQLYGRGTVDAKGPLAAFAVAAAQTGPRPGWRIVVAGATEEEAVSSRGAHHLLATWPRPTAVIVGEPSGWQRITLGYKGRLLASVSVTLPLAHRSGGTVTASEVAVGFWNRATHILASMNAGRTRVWEQVLPALRSFQSTEDGLYETATLQLSFRLPLDHGPEEIEQLLLGLAHHERLTFSGPEVAFQAPKNTPLVRAFLAGIRAQGGDPGFLFKTGTSDMNVVGPVWDCPILAYGPGDSRLDHTPDEHVDLGDWWRGVGVIRHVLSQLDSWPLPV
jgi:[amino group carrier protein]-lysine/ornithine hydrolase